jgi:hypothetical protein
VINISLLSFMVPSSTLACIPSPTSFSVSYT